jgi:hypothetical protein
MGRILAEPVQVETFTLEPIVGASLLANRPFQSTNIATDTASSRAGMLPQVIRVAEGMASFKESK